MWRKSIGYEIQEMLGEGSQGRVFKALRQDPAAGLTETVAVKILHSETAVDLWRREFESLRRVRSPFCVQVFAFERIEGRPALILEYVNGVSLSAFSQSSLLNEDEIGEILSQLETAVLDLYKSGVFHGDLSPHNILIDIEGRLRLLDFGLANCAGADIRLTPEFAAPERHAGESAGLASDIFSLGRIEQFLRGQNFGPDKSSPYLCLDPGKRSLRGICSEPEAREKLKHKVSLLHERKRIANSLSTRTIGIPARRPKTFVLGLITSCLLVTASSASPNFHSHAPELLQIRTNRWHYFILDGNPVGYSPISIPLSAGRVYKLEWISARGRGVKTLKMKPHVAHLLQDRDFSH